MDNRWTGFQNNNDQLVINNLDSKSIFILDSSIIMFEYIRINHNYDHNQFKE